MFLAAEAQKEDGFESLLAKKRLKTYYSSIMRIIAELWRAKRACGAPWVSKSTHPRKFGNHVTVHRLQPARPSVRTTGIPMFTLTLSSQVLSSYFGSPGES